jgi:hypothetical protein
LLTLYVQVDQQVTAFCDGSPVKFKSNRQPKICWQLVISEGVLPDESVGAKIYFDQLIRDTGTYVILKN